MKKIVLIGDSIRLGYDKYIKDAFDGVCSVFSSDENGKFAVNVLRFAHEWKNTGNWGDDVDVVHWNAGLWDVLHIFSDKKTMTPIDCYADYIKRIDKHLRMLFPKAKMIFATSTAVLEKNYDQRFFRYNREIEQYNAVAIDALKETDTEIDDLYAVTKNAPESCYSDAVTHFNTKEGVELVGGKVLDVLCAALGMDKATLKDKNSAPVKIDEKTLGF